MKYPKVQYELDLNAKYACRFFEKNGFDYKNLKKNKKYVLTMTVN